MEWMFLPLKRYAQFSGRSRRMEYWMWILFTILAGIVLGIVDAVLGLSGDGSGSGNPLRNGLLGNIFSLATFLPSLAVAVRRLHDTNRSGWWILLPVVPLIVAAIAFFGGAASGTPFGSGSIFIVAMLAGLVALICSILLLVWYCTAGTDGPNDYGDDPKSDIPSDLAATFE